MVIPPEEGGLKEVIDVDNNIISSDSTLNNISPPQLKKMTSQYKVMWGCECLISSKSMHSYLLTCQYSCLKYLKYIIRNAQNIRSGEISSRIFEIYRNVVRYHGCDIYNTTAGMAMAKICPFTYKHHGIMH